MDANTLPLTPPPDLEGNDPADTPLDPLDESLAEQIASGAKIADIAHSGTCARATIYRRLKSPALRARIEQLRASMREVAVGKLHLLAAEAVDRLGELIRGGAPQIQVSAARAVLDKLELVRGARR